MLASMTDKEAREVYNTARAELQAHQQVFRMSRQKTYSQKDFHYRVEILVMYEALHQGLGMWGRAKRRTSLALEYAT